MTISLERPPAATAGPGEARSPLVSGVVAAAWAAVLGLAIVGVPVIIAWVLAPHAGTSPSDAMRAGTFAWLEAHHGILTTTAGPISLVPLGLIMLPAALLYRTGRWAGRVSVDGAAAATAATAAMTAAYTTITAIVAASTPTPTTGVAPASVVIGSVVLAAVAGGLGVLSGARMLRPAIAAVPVAVRDTSRAALAGLAVLLGGGALLLALSLLAHLGELTKLSTALHAGSFGGVLLLVLGVLALPSGVVWAASYAVGPGFAVGVGTSVAPAGVALGPVPAFPLLAALPGTGQAPAASLIALATPVLAGIVVGLFCVRRPSPTGGATAGRAFLAGALAGIALGALAALSAGSLGAVRMSQLGPDGLRVGLVAALEVGAVAAVVAWEGLRQEERLRAFADAVRARVAPLVAKVSGRSAPPTRS